MPCLCSRVLPGSSSTPPVTSSQGRGLQLQNLGFMDPLHSPGRPPCDSRCTIHGACGKDAEDGTWASQTHPTPGSPTTPSFWKVSLAAGSRQAASHQVLLHGQGQLMGHGVPFCCSGKVRAKASTVTPPLSSRFFMTQRRRYSRLRLTVS